jgi:hypothetical protein
VVLRVVLLLQTCVLFVRGQGTHKPVVNAQANGQCSSLRPCTAGLQGIKFYDPEIVGDTPEAVEYRGLANLLDAVAEHLGFEDGKVGVRVCSVVAAGSHQRV